MPAPYARSMIANASSCGMPWPKNAGAEPMPPKFPQPRLTPVKTLTERSGAGKAGTSASSDSPASLRLRQVHVRQLVPHVPELGVERVVNQAAHDLDRRALRADDVAADRALHDLEVAHAPHGDALVELDQLLGEVVELLVLAAERVHLDERQAGALARGVERLAEQLADTAKLLEAGRVEAAAVP